MKISRTTLVIVATVLLLGGGGLLLLYYGPWSGDQAKGGVSDSAATATSGEHVHAADEYYCPMHPQVVSDRPGVCPICHMDLIPRAAEVPGSMESMSDSGVDSGLVRLSARGRIVAGVATTPVTSRSMTSVVTAAASVDYNEATHKVISARYAGRVERLLVDRTGDYVRIGTPLMEVYSPDLVAAQQEFLIALETPQIDLPPSVASETEGLAERTRTRTRRLVESARKRLALLGMSQSQIAALEKRGQVAMTTTVTATASGTVIQRMVNEGAYVNVGSTLYELVDLSSVYVIANVAETDAWRVRAGQELVVSGPAIGGEVMHGRVEYIYPTVDPTNRTVRVRGIFPNSGMRLKPGMYLTAEILAPQGDAVVVPVSAVIRTGRRDLVYVEVEPNTFEPREVKLGVRDGDCYQIIGGKLARGERVVTEGGFLIDSERRLTTPAGGGSHAGHNMETKP